MSFNNANVVMLPNNQKTNGMICKDITGQDKIIAIKTKYLMEHEDYIGHHLYIISDDEIKEGDWFVNIRKNTIHLCNGVNNNICSGQNHGEYHGKFECKKIISTTDKSLELPQPPQQFIEEYIEEYNQENIITDVLVEYENKFYGKECVD